MPRKTAVSKYLAEIGRKGGTNSGPARMEKMTPEERSAVAKKAAAARWAKKPEAKPNPAAAGAFELHFTVRELADLWRFDVATVRRWFHDEPGVLVHGK